MTLNKLQNAFSRTVLPIGAYYPIAASDWGELAPGTTGTAFAAALLTDNAGGGSLANSTAAVKITWVTSTGETAASVEATKVVTGGPSGSLGVAITGLTLNTGAQASSNPILGWRIYSGNGAGNELLNLAANSLSVAMISTGSSLSYIPIATTSANVLIYGAGQAPPSFNASGINNLSLPNIAASTSSDVDIPVPPAFRVQRLTSFSRPDGVTDTVGISVDACDCIAPLWAASTAFSLSAYIVINGTLFQCTTAGTSASVANFPAAFGTSVKGGTVTDNGATWTNRGKAVIVRMRFSNGTVSAAQPKAMSYNIYQP